MHGQPRRRSSIAVLLPILLVAAGCGAAGSGNPTPVPSATPQPTPTPVTAKVASPGDAASLVIATNPLFANAVPLTSDLIGASRWWEAEPLAGGGYRIKLTVGWGDCPAGCIERHAWTFDVDGTGGVTLVSESGDPVPSGLPE